MPTAYPIEWEDLPLHSNKNEQGETPKDVEWEGNSE